jgi:carbon monoxide dehydrogenase subunit G
VRAIELARKVGNDVLDDDPGGQHARAWAEGAPGDHPGDRQEHGEKRSTQRNFRKVPHHGTHYTPSTPQGRRPTEKERDTMASIRKEISIDARPEDVWAALRDVGALHTRLVPGFVVDTRLEEGARIVTFGNGTVARELIVDVDDETRRVVWSVVGGRFTHHNASAQVFADGAGRSRFVWIADLLPSDLVGDISALMEQGSAVIKKTLERT